jgi:protein SCO1/2
MLIEKYFKTFLAVGFTMVLTCSAGLVMATEPMDHSKMGHGKTDQGQQNADEHAQHSAMMDQKGYSREEVSYQLPDVMLTDQNGDKVSAAALLNGEDPMMVSFIFTTCTTICPVLSAIFAQAQKRYSNELDGVKLISISIDPEYDTPARLQEYARRFHAQEGWTFLTGDLEAVIEVLDSFDAYFGDKMNHLPLTFIHKPGSSTWLRLEGFPDASDLVEEYQTS